MSETPKDAKGIFLAALDVHDAAERAAFVARSCESDEVLRRRVEDLLHAFSESDGPLDRLPAGLAATGIHEPLREQVGSTIGPYKLMEQIGEGGFGLVFVAEQQQPLRRKVALKIIKPGMDTRDVIARFEAERQALALMDHPNIARVLDAGTTASGRPYFVMELVRGLPITDFCDQTQLTPRERLGLFVDVCNAVQHAHQKGIIHRDIKPSNVLVTLHDDRPVVKVIDFGVAKALHQRLTEKTIYTRLAQLVGTPLYMSPEQAQRSGLDIDTRSDIYSLGVLLYELLTGTTPFDKRRLAKVAFDELLKMIREEDPPKPSVRLSQSTETLPSIAAQRKTEPAKLSKMFHGDVDWIAMKALEKDRARRYETANAFAADVLRYLNDEPVEASPPSTAYRLRKFARKHRKPVIAMAAIAAVLLIGIAGTTWGLFRARFAEQAAKTAEREAVGSEQKAVSALEQVTKKREATERQLANGLLRPIGFSYTPESAELHGFVDWSALTESSLKLRVLEIAFENPETALKVAHREERAIQSCVGISPTRRAQAIKLVNAKQRDLTADPRIRIAACWFAMELGSHDLPAWVESCNYLSNPKNQSIARFYEFVLAASRSDPRLNTQLNFDPLLVILETSTNNEVQQVLRNAVLQLAPRLEPAQVKRAVDALIADWEKGSGVQSFGDELKALAPRLEPEQVKRAGDSLIAVLEKSTDKQAISEASWGLSALAPRLEPAQVKRVGDAVIGFLQKSSDDIVLNAARSGLKALATRLEPAHARRAVDALFAIFQKSVDNRALDALGALAPFLEPAQAKRVWDEVNANPKIDCYRLTPLAARLGPAQVKETADAWIAMLEKSTDNRALDLAASRLQSLVPRLEPAQVKRAGDAVIAVLGKSTDQNVLNAANNGLTVLAPRLEPVQLKHAADAAIAMLENSTELNRNDSWGMCRTIAMAPLLEAAQVKRIGDAMTLCFEKSCDNEVLFAATRGLIALAPRLEPAPAKRVWDAVIAVPERVKLTDEGIAGADGWAAALVALAPRLEPASRDNLAMTATAVVLDYYSSCDLNYGPSEVANSIMLSRSISSPRSLAKLLSHPACIAEQREVLLKRFEELVFHDGKPVFLKPDATDDKKLADDQPPPRRFHHLHDAADWIQKNWPDFDLETNCPVTWRGSR